MSHLSLTSVCVCLCVCLCVCVCGCVCVYVSVEVCACIIEIGPTNYRNGPQRTATDRNGPQRTATDCIGHRNGPGLIFFHTQMTNSNFKCSKFERILYSRRYKYMYLWGPFLPSLQVNVFLSETLSIFDQILKKESVLRTCPCIRGTFFFKKCQSPQLHDGRVKMHPKNRNIIFSHTVSFNYGK